MGWSFDELSASHAPLQDLLIINKLDGMHIAIAKDIIIKNVI